MDKVKSEKVISFLTELADQNGGILLPETVVDRARPVDSPIHNYFTWEDTEAAEKWRIHEARQLLRVVVNVIPVNGENRETRVFVSLTTDRVEGGYRPLVKVLSNEEHRSQLLQDALEELQLVKEKYKGLKELSEVFQAIDSIRELYATV